MEPIFIEYSNNRTREQLLKKVFIVLEKKKV